ncbi:thioredoxin [Burkholderia multivorans]|uniref:thioredoxin n=1 Tax=Burkholderia multivorans TaxID=87883 RepID=UPI001C236303|nr:thioredoxin [Burkholderia multivorans]MBU9200279.1 thioredoxin [Burkholderia multivorans]MDN8078595.1 thioredoxin [Burkholderia multivorans]
MPDIKTPSDLQDKILSADVALLDFWAPWCGPCKAMMPALEKLQQSNPSLVIGKVNCDENSELAKTFGVRAIPTLVLVKKGEVKETLVGAQTFERLQKFVNA